MCVKNYKLFAEQHALTNQVPVSIRFLTRLSRNRVSDCLTSALVVYTEGAKCGFLDPQIAGLLASRPAI